MPIRAERSLDEVANDAQPTDDLAEVARRRREAEQLEEEAVVAEAWGVACSAIAVVDE